MLRRRLAPALLLVLGVASSVAAGEPTERLRTLFAEANRVLMAPDGGASLDKRVDAVRALVNEVFDTQEAAARALGREWQARTPVEREEFVRLYADLVERAYLAWIGSRARVNGDGVRIAFESESVQGDRATVRTTLQTRAGDEMPVEYRMRRRDGRWVVLDVAVDGSSLADSYRAQFQRVLQGGTYADLVDRLHDRASPATLIAIAKARTARRAAMAAASAPVRVASAPTASDAPAAASRVTTPIMTAAASVGTPDAPPPRPTAPDVVVPHSPVVPPVAVEPPPTASAAPMTPAAPLAIVPAARKWFWIQVGAFRDISSVSRLVARLRQYSVTIATAGRRPEPLSRVLVGPFASREAAAATLRELAAGGYAAFIAFE
jgi:phospholipid transport system substrate-binding protein